jgi:phosphoserine phosphatase RsbU/P
MKATATASSLLESMGIGYFEMDLKGLLTHANKDFFEALGYEAHELLGKHFRRYIPREKVSWMFNVFQMIHITRLVETKFPFEFVYKDGSPRYAEGWIGLLLDEDGTPTGFKGILTEITARKEKETTLIQQKRRAERELEIAREIQQSFLVKDYPQPPGWEIATRIRPARQVGGDFYDVFPIASSKHIALIMADVCDKGVGAAMYMAIFRSLLRAYADQQYVMRWAGVPDGNQLETQTGVFRRDAILASGAPTLKNAIDLTNNFIATLHGDSNMFATVFFGLLDPSDGSLLYINAGHEAPLVISNVRVNARLHPTGPAVGMLPSMDFKIESVVLSPGDTLVLFTDGVTDALSPDHEQFQESALIEAATAPAPSAQGRLQKILSALDTHIAGREQFDDITLLAVTRKSLQQ